MAIDAIDIDPAVPPQHRHLELVRVFDAPRELVFHVWSEAAHLAQWWGPDGFTNPVCEVDFRPGGTMHIVMRGPDGADYPMTAVFDEIAAPERIAFTATVDEGPEVHFEVRTTVTFAEHGGGTRVALNAEVLKATAGAAPYLAGMEAGWTQSLERLRAHLEAAG